MLTRFLFFTGIIFVVTFITLVLFGTKIKYKNFIFSALWLTGNILLGGFLYELIIGELAEINYFGAITLIFGLIWISLKPNWNAVAKTSWTMTVLVTFLFLVYTFGVTAFATASLAGYILALIFFFLEVAALLLSLSYAYEALDVLCRSVWKRGFDIPPKIPGFYPKISIHVPAYNEPPEVVANTLESLSNLNYPNYEVLLIDNNTSDENVWKPLIDICKRLGPKFNFLHLSKWPGFKSGALNFALSQTAADAEIIAIVDADYLVDPDFLSDLIPAFANPLVAFVQTPQDYRNTKGNSFFKSTYFGYKYFFEISMRSRNEKNAIIFAGTMGLIRKRVLQEIGGWDEWCITEDAEASLRILKKGYEALYINKSYGRGLMPLTFDGFKKQRFRWCFGGIQILKKHWPALMPWASHIDPKNKLTFTQKYYYLFGGLQWYNDLLNLLFTLFLILGGILNLLPEARGFLPLTLPLLVLPGIFLVTGLWRFVWVLKNILNLDLKKTLSTMENFFSLGWAVALGSIQGLVQKNGVFLRTPKVKSKVKIFGAVAATQWETLIGILCLASATAIFVLRPSLATFIFSMMLTWEASLFLSAPVFSLISLKEFKPRSLGTYTTDGEPGGVEIAESNAALWVLFFALAISVILVASGLLPSSPQPSSFSRLNPAEAPVENTLRNIPTNSTTQSPTLSPTPLATEIVGPTPEPTASDALPTALPSNQPTSIPTVFSPEPTQTAFPTPQPPASATIEPPVI